MTDQEALAVLGALAAEPYFWAQPGVRFRWTARYPRSEPDRVDVHTGVVLRRYDVLDGGVGVRLGTCSRDYFSFADMRRYVDEDGDAFEPLED